MGKVINRIVRSMDYEFFKKETPPGRYELFFRGNLLVFAGYLIATIETIIAINLGLTELSFAKTYFISSFVMILTFILTFMTWLTRVKYIWQEALIFILYLATFLFAFCVWVYWLGELRFLGILNGLTAVTIVLSYTNVFQSLGMSVSTLLCYYSVVWYSIRVAGQPGSFEKETFFALCLVPAFMLISAAAYYMNRQRKELQRASAQLEALNANLRDANDDLQIKQKLIEIEMDLAREIQTAVMPSKPPETRDWEVAFFSKPYGAVTGDFFDIYHRDGSLQGISLFDVSGHGVAPALITILAKPVVYSLFNKSVDGRLGDVFQLANGGLLDELETVNLYITGVIVKMNESEVEYSNAGHPDIIYYNASARKASILTDEERRFKGHPIGISVKKSDYRSIKIDVENGDFMVLYSDGLTEIRNPEKEEFGRNRLVDVIESSRSRSAESLLNEIIDSMNIFTCGMKPIDDITLIVAYRL